MLVSVVCCLVLRYGLSRLWVRNVFVVCSVVGMSIVFMLYG